MWRYTQEISIIVFILLCVVVFALTALLIVRAIKRKKTSIVFYILLAIFAVILGCVIFATIVAGSPHPIAPPV